MINPDKYIRSAYISALGTATGLTVYDKGIPKDTEVLPNQYIILHSQTKQPTAVSKDLWEWNCQIAIDIISVSEKGYPNSVSVEDIEQQVLTAVESGITIPLFNNKLTRFQNSQPLDIETLTQTINRKVVTYEHWLNNIQTT